KTCSYTYRLKAAVSSFTDELRILERLYYKSKNQHRMALFFKCVPEIRRYGKRTRRIRPPGTCRSFHASFIGLNS
ncbi:hypothetical protein BU15DRAFT_15488, partial [Melanogaster broomeanus]